jgi:hypothetical protein
MLKKLKVDHPLLTGGQVLMLQRERRRRRKNLIEPAPGPIVEEVTQDEELTEEEVAFLKTLTVDLGKYMKKK